MPKVLLGDAAIDADQGGSMRDVERCVLLAL